MPPKKMDIRSFFKAKKTEAKSETTSEKSKSVSSPIAPTAAVARAMRQEKKKAAPVEHESKPKAKRSLVIDDSESENDDEPQVKAVEVKPSSTGKRSSAAAKRTIDRADVSAADFFKESPTKKPKTESPRKAAVKKALKESIDAKMSAEATADVESSVIDKQATPTSKARKRVAAAVNYQEDDHGDDDEKDYQPSPKKTASAKKTSPKRKTPASSAKKPQRDPPLQPSRTATSIDPDALVSECLKDYTFVCSGVLANLARDDCQELIKTLGGRVTGAVSGKTDYLIVGDVLEDGRPYTEGSKYKAAMEKDIIIVKGEEELYGLILQYDEKARQRDGLPPLSVSSSPVVALAAAHSSSMQVADTKPGNDQSATAATAAKPIPNPYALPNPYAKKPMTNNPYARSRNSDASAGPTASTSVSNVALKDCKPAAIATTDDTNQLWVDKYKPSSTGDILGNTDVARKLAAWLERWETRFNNPQSYGKAFSNPQGPWKAALLSGPPGIGKTTSALVVANEAGRDVIEFNASDVRSKKSLGNDIGDVTGSRTLEFGVNNKRFTEATRKKRVIIMDEVDGMGGGDRGGMAELIQLIKHSRVPIICICNDRQNQKMKSLIPYCLDLRCRRPVKGVIAKRALEIARREGMIVEQNAAEAIAESCGNDVRQVINCLQMWANSNKGNSAMTYKGVRAREKTTNKDEMLRVSLFDAAKMILEGPKGEDKKSQRDNFFKRNDAFFVDYNFIGLIVQQNYLKLLQHPYGEAKRMNNKVEVQNVLERMHAAADTLSDYAVAEAALRGDQNWSLLPFSGLLTVKTGFHAAGERGGFLPGYPEFTTYLGRNSTKGKKSRMLSELRHHTNFKISGTMQELRSWYLPVLRNEIMTALQKEGGADEAIDIMDTYGLDRDDVMEKLDEFLLDSKQTKFEKLDTKKKSEFTRIYNQRTHTSQALVAEQGAGKKKRAKASNGSGESMDPDAIDDDAVAEEAEEDDDDDEMDEAKIKALFGKKKRGRAAPAAGAAKKKAAPKAKSAAAPKRTKKK
ncbi:hypothetical protein MPSEU_000298700 [Mayamaea pseudoterrestris]|nr:hypothetical protein MPSEU_000298700 [Mayamaea pseudoterrestris]